VVPLVVLAPACAVSFNDYALGDPHQDASSLGGQTGAAGTDSSVAGTVPDETPSGTGGGGSPTVVTGGSGGGDSAGGGSGNASGTGPSGGDVSVSGSGGTPPLGMAGEPAVGEAGAPSVNPPVTVVLTANIIDTYVSEGAPGFNYGNDPTLVIDSNGAGGWGSGSGGWSGGRGSDTHEALIRVALDSLPADAVVSAATLSFKCTRVGDPVAVAYITTTWQEGLVYWNIKPQRGPELGSFKGDAALNLTIDLKQAVSAWLAGDRENFGIYLSPDPAKATTSATECASTEALDVTKRPRLSVTYTLP
jgi:hypothetical protein